MLTRGMSLLGRTKFSPFGYIQTKFDMQKQKLWFIESFYTKDSKNTFIYFLKFYVTAIISAESLFMLF